MNRPDGRQDSELRKVNIIPDYIKYAEGSVLIEMGQTKVICNASVEESVPPYIKDTGRGWVTAEYSMLPRATHTRSPRDIAKLKASPRSTEIQRLIGRALRSVTCLEALGEKSVILDCDVIQADGGTRCASITGGFAALYLAFRGLKEKGLLDIIPLFSHAAAVSAGIFEGRPVLDLCYEEDHRATVDFNFIMNEKGEIIELQGTGEQRPFTKEELDAMYRLSEKGIEKLVCAQKKVTGEICFVKG